jgi:hypothetical protein
MGRYLAAQAATGRSGVAAIGLAHEYQNVFAPTQHESYNGVAWFSFTNDDRTHRSWTSASVGRWLIGRGAMPHALGKNMGETEGADLSPEPVLIEVVAPDASAASQILRSYINDVASRYYGRQATDDEIDAARGEDPASTWRLHPACSSLPVSVALSSVAQGLACFRKGSARSSGSSLLLQAEAVGSAPASWASWQASLPGMVCQYYAWTPATTSSNPAGCMPPAATRQCPPSDDGRYAEHWLAKPLA